MEFEGRRGGANGFGEANNLFYGFTLHVKGDEQGRDLGVRALASENFGHNGARLCAGERLPVVREAMENVENHLESQSYLSEEFLSNRGRLAG